MCTLYLTDKKGAAQHMDPDIPGLSAAPIGGRETCRQPILQ